MTTPTAHPPPGPVRDILLAAADLLDRPGAWCRGQYARDRRGQATSPYAEDAVSWCATGALMRVSREADVQDCRATRARLDETLFLAGHVPDISFWNDACTIRDEVVEMLRRAAEEEA